MEAFDLRLRYNSASKIAITGATGYLGRNFAVSLAGQTVGIHQSDIPEGTVLIHLASIIAPSDSASVPANLALDLTVLKIAAEKNLRLIYASGNNVYPKALGCDLNTSYQITDYYAASKIFGEQLIQASSLSSWAILRIGDLFGVGQKHGNLFKAIEDRIRTKQPLQLYGRGLKTRNFIYIDEMKSVLLHIAKLLHAEPLRFTANICEKNPTSVMDLITALADISGLPIEPVKMANDTSHLDVRTMVQTAIPGYVYRYENHQALDAYVQAIRAS